MITVDLLMSTKPCERWPRERVEALLARPEIDRSSWVRFAESCLVADAVSLADLRLTAYRAATPAQRLIGVRRSTRIRIEAQTRRWPTMSDAVSAVRADLLRWCDGGPVDLVDVRHHVASAYAAPDAPAAFAAAHASGIGSAVACAYAAADHRAGNGVAA